MDSFNKVVLNYDFATHASDTYGFGNFRKFTRVTISLVWDSLDDTDSVVKFMQRADSTSPWLEATGLSYTLNSASGTYELISSNFASGEVGLDVNNGSVTTGTLTVIVIAKMLEAGSSGGGSGGGVTYITDPVIIAVITDGANWDGNGDYIGSTTSLTAGDVYFDLVNGYRYEYDGTNLTRGMINNTI